MSKFFPFMRKLDQIIFYWDPGCNIWRSALLCNLQLVPFFPLHRLKTAQIWFSAAKRRILLRWKFCRKYFSQKCLCCLFQRTPLSFLSQYFKAAQIRLATAKHAAVTIASQVCHKCDINLVWGEQYTTERNKKNFFYKSFCIIF